ncbi:ankyrin repeat domain-containing protein [Ramlibacter humi]|nr:ankyrin repeat domain-containing protein [Ramlibacter humi]
MTSFAVRRMAALALVLSACALLASCGVKPGPLHNAAIAGDIEFVRSWIRSGRPVDVDSSEYRHHIEHGFSYMVGVRPLMLASGMGHLDVMKALVDAGADIYAESVMNPGDCDGCRSNAFDYAVYAGQVEAARYLWSISDGKRLGKRLEQQLALACMEKCRDGAAQDETTNLALFLASIASDQALGRAIGQVGARDGGSAQLEFLRAHRVRFPPNTLHPIATEPTFRMSPAQFKDHLQRAELLLRLGGDPNNPYGARQTTPLMLAAGEQNLDLVKLFVSHGANVDQRGPGGESAVSWAVSSCPSNRRDQKEELDMVNFLVNAGARPTVPARTERFLRETCCAPEQRNSEYLGEICRKLGVN